MDIGAYRGHFLRLVCVCEAVREIGRQRVFGRLLDAEGTIAQ